LQFHYAFIRFRSAFSVVAAQYTLLVTTSDLRLNGREFDPRPPHYRSVDTGTGDRPSSGGHTTSVCNCSHPGQLSLLPNVGWEMSTGHSTVMRCGWGVKAGWLIPFVLDKTCG